MPDHAQQTPDLIRQVSDLCLQQPDLIPHGSTDLTPPSFKYSPIAPGWIRILELASKPDEPLQCRLRHVKLQSPEADYIALSYVWGDTSKPFTMRVLQTIRNGDDSPAVSGTIPLTTSLYDALRDLRDCDDIRPKTFWMDQICINQDDDNEKSDQVAQMRKVFEYATQVVTYLGRREEQDDEALGLLKRISDYYEPLTQTTVLAGVNETSCKRPSMRGRYRREVDTIPPELVFPEDLWQGEGFDIVHHLLEILSGPWTKRLWLFQENVVNSNTKFLRGCRSIAWGPIRLVTLLSYVGILPYARTYEILAILRRREAWKHKELQTSMQPRGLALRRLLDQASKRYCWDPKDKIYALLGLAVDAEELNIAPDYTKSTAQAFTDLAVAFVMRDVSRQRSLSNLSWSSRGYSSNPSIPSWVSAYSDDGYGLPLNTDADASRIFSQDFSLELAKFVHFESSSSVSNGILVTKGLRLGFKLERSLGTFPSARLVHALRAQKLTKALAVFENAQESHDASDQSLAFIFDTLSMGQFRETAEAAAAQAVRDILNFLRRAQSGERIKYKAVPERFFLPTSSLPGGVNSAAYRLLEHGLFRRRSLWIADNQGLCLTPNRAQMGDIAVILFGGDWVYFLRPLGDKFEYIGWGYVAGCMHGEPFEVDDWESNVETFKLI